MTTRIMLHKTNTYPIKLNKNQNDEALVKTNER